MTRDKRVILDQAMIIEEASEVCPYSGNGCGYSNSGYERYDPSKIPGTIELRGSGIPGKLQSFYFGFAFLGDNWFNYRKYKDFYYWDTLVKYQNSIRR
jgi:hypothetical protein